MYVCITRLGDWTGYVFCSGPDGVTIEQDWETYYQTDDLRSAGGSGLGLSIAREVLERHGLSFGAENVDAGVSFWFQYR